MRRTWMMVWMVLGGMSSPMVQAACVWQGRDATLLGNAGNVPHTVADIAADISVHPHYFSHDYAIEASESLDGSSGVFKVRIVYPQISGHPDQGIEKKINTYLRQWAGVDADHRAAMAEHQVLYQPAWQACNLLSLALVDNGSVMGAATGYTFYQTLVMDLLDARVLTLDDLLRPGYRQPLTRFVQEQAFCDAEKTQRIFDLKALPEDLKFFLDQQGDLVLVFQRGRLCANADGPTLITVDADTLRPWVNPEGPLAGCRYSGAAPAAATQGYKNSSRILHQHHGDHVNCM